MVQRGDLLVSERRLRVLAVASHVVQYASPVYRLLAASDQVDFQVAYCSMRGAEAGHDAEFGAVVKWDVPLLDGYAWKHVANHGSGNEGFFGLYNPGLWKFIRDGKFDAVICYTGYLRASFWISYFAAKTSGAAFMFGNDVNTLAPRDHRGWKLALKKRLWPLLFRLADQTWGSSTPARDLLVSLGLPPERVTLIPITVDNDWWVRQSALVQRHAVRQSWGASPDDAVVLFCAKLQPWKRPFDLLQAFAPMRSPKTLLVFAGDGPLRGELEAEAAKLGVASHVRFLGFANQSDLPAVYSSADVMVLPSEFEPFAVVVSEAMCCGCPVIASDAVGSAPDLIVPVEPGFIYPAGDVKKLTEILTVALADRASLRQFGDACRARMRSWSPAQNVSGTIEAVKLAVAHSRKNYSER
jgi:glycosyltransferase involved in cell wall biosynthesis